MNRLKVASIAALAFSGVTASPALALTDCSQLPSHDEARDALQGAVAADNGGFGLQMWVSIVNRDGVVCAVAFSGEDRGEQWPGSRVISAQKASTANAFSLPGLALSTANLWAATQPGGSLFGLQFSNPVATDVAYGGHGNGKSPEAAKKYGLPNDPMGGRIVGGVNVFGGGLALYDDTGTLLGALGVSGDSSCADHNIAWRVRDALSLDYVPAGVNKKNPADPGTDNIIYDVVTEPSTGLGVSASGFGHVACGPAVAAGNAAIVAACPVNDGASPNCL